MTFALVVPILFTSFVYRINMYWSLILGIKRKPHLSVVWNWYNLVAIAILHQPRPTDSADINTRLQLSDTISLPPKHGGFLLISSFFHWGNPLDQRSAKELQGLCSPPPVQNGRNFGRRYFQMHFLWMKIMKFWFKFHWNLFPIDNKSVLVQVMAWRIWRQAAITWTNDGPVHWRIYAALGGDGFKPLDANLKTRVEFKTSVSLQRKIYSNIFIAFSHDWIISTQWLGYFNWK